MERVKRTWDIPQGLVDRIDALAGERGLYKNDLVIWLLAVGAERLRRGEVEVPTRAREILEIVWDDVPGL